jgi:hypothetical protein
MALAFVLPAVESCRDEVDSALDASLRESSMAAWVAPPYLAALVLAAVTLIALSRKRSPTKAWAWLSAALIATGIATSLTVPWRIAIEASEARADVVLPVLAMVGAATICVRLVVSALRKGGWSRWYGLLAAHAVLAAPLAVFLGTLAMGDELRVGAYVYVGALSALVALQVAGRLMVWRSRGRSLGRGHPALAGIAGGEQPHGGP